MNIFPTRTAALALALTFLSAASWAGTRDAWITTKTKIALLTAEDIKVTAVHVDTKDGVVTLHGKVRTAAEKQRAEDAARKVDGVTKVSNELQVVPESMEKAVEATDKQIQEKTQALIKADESLKGIKVDSVDKGVVRLTGEASTMDAKLNAIEKAWTVSGVKQVRDEISAKESAPAN
jgi:hyperosmotically inducible protein